MHRPLLLAMTILWLLITVRAALRGEDWPTCRHDNRRSGVTGESLRPPLALRWTFRSCPPAPGWPPPVSGYGARKKRANVSHDDAYRVVVAGGLCYLSSSGDDRVYALDADTGEVRWSADTDAAPRLAPVVHEGRVYVGADDGVFRCLDARDGRAVWTYRAAPRPDLVLGHGRFTSVWPIRAGGIVEGGVVYLTSGLFPSCHIWLHALDAESGELEWRRRLDAGGRGAVVPQGHMLAAGDSLFTTSRVAPARWRASDGARVPMETPFPDVPDAHEYRYLNGGSYAQVWSGGHIVYGRAGLLAYDPDHEFRDRWGRAKRGGLVFHWFGARAAVSHAGVVYLATDDHLLAVDRARLPELSRGVGRELESAYKKLRVASYLDLLDRRRDLRERHGPDDPRVRDLARGPLRWGAEAWQRWQERSPELFRRLEGECRWLTPLCADDALILAGDVLYAGSADAVHALDASDGRVLWRAETGAPVRGLAVSGGRLLVSTTDGRIRCYTRETGRPSPGESDGSRPLPPGTAAATGSRLPEPGPLAPELVDVVRRVEGRAGYALLLGAPDGGRLAEELLRATSLHLEVASRKAGEVAAVRSRLRTRRLYGPRAAARILPERGLPYPPYVFDVVVDVGSLLAAGSVASLDAVVRVTRPCGGVAIVGGATSGDGSAPPALSGSSLGDAGVEVSGAGPAWRLERGAIPGARDWTHDGATPARTYSSEDPLVHGPFGVLWYGEPGPRRRIDRHRRPPLPLVVSGRFFTIGVDRVMAYDLYNGRLHWEVELAGVARTDLPFDTSNLAADAASLFVVVAREVCLRFDQRTGRELGRYAPPSVAEGGSPPRWAWVARAGDLLLGSVAALGDRGAVDPVRSRAVFALDVADGERRWLREGEGIEHAGIAVADGRVFLLDRRVSDGERAAARRPGGDSPPPDEPPPVDRRGRPWRDVRRLVALDLETGEPRWERVLDLTDITRDDMLVQGRATAGCMVKDGVLVVHGPGSVGHPHREFLAGRFARRALYAFGARSGDFLWGGRLGYRKRPVIVGDRIYAEPFAWSLRTGEPVRVPNPISGEEQRLDFHRGYIGCGHLLASAGTLFGARGGISWFCPEDPAGFVPFAGMELACGIGAVPAGGVFVAPEGRSGCTCATPIHTSIALYPRDDAPAWGIGFSGGRAEVRSLPVRHLRINLGAPGYRRDPDGNLWIPYPERVDGGPVADWLPTYQHDASDAYRFDGLWTPVAGTDRPWIYTSGYHGTKPLRLVVAEPGEPPRRFRIRLHFAEPGERGPGDRRFRVLVDGRDELGVIDPAAEAGGPRRALVREIEGVEAAERIELRLVALEGEPSARPILCGVEILRED